MRQRHFAWPCTIPFYGSGGLLRTLREGLGYCSVFVLFVFLFCLFFVVVVLFLVTLEAVSHLKFSTEEYSLVSVHQASW